MFKRFRKRMKSPKYRAWLRRRIEVIVVLLFLLVSITAMVIAPLASKADTGDMTEQTTAATTYPTEAETAATEPPTAPQPTETEVTEATENTEAVYTYFDCELSEDLQEFIFGLCEEKQIDPAIIVAMCWKESTYTPGVVGDGGNSYGLMQIQPRWHYERMQRLGCTDLLDPYQNITVGVDYLCELLEQYGSIDKALTAYNQGHYSGTVTDYAKTVIAKAELLGVKE